jgi:flavin-dependent dehydrogenase
VVITPRESLEAELVVVSTGINNRSILDPAWGYRPPQFEVMAQDEVNLLDSSLGSHVHVFINHPAGLIFGGVIPKGRYANISLLGKNLPRDSIAQFLDQPDLAPLLTDTPPGLCGCTPRVAITSARGYYHDRMVVVGDAAVTRLYKDGIGSAFTTARAAIQTAVFRGISQLDFAQGYHPICRRIAIDNGFGHWLFRLWGLSRHSPLLVNAWKQVIMSEALLPARSRVHERVLWGVLTGDESYGRILALLLSRPALRSFLREILRRWSKR